MPELPEVETIRLSLAKNIVGKTIKSIQVLSPKQFVGDVDSIVRQNIVSIDRKGKVMAIKLSNNLYLSIHLKMSGQILFSKNVDHAVYGHPVAKANTSTMPGKTTRIIIEFADNSAIFFNDLRKFGWIKLGNKPEEPMGPDVLSADFTVNHLKKVLSSSRKPIKVLLLDQDKIAGIGNIYANDSLWEAKINPLRVANTLNDVEVGELYKGILTIIHEGIKYKGSSSADEAYVLPDASKGGYQHHRRVYHRTGLPCLRDGHKIMRVRQAGRSSFFCPHCQK